MVAVLPEAPLLVPELAPGASPELQRVRTAAVAAARRLAGATRRWIAVGADAAGRRTVGPDVRGSFCGFGVDLEIALGPAADGAPDPALPLPLLMAGWAAAAAGAPVPVRGELVAPDAPPPACTALGSAIAAEAAAEPGPVGLLVLADGPDEAAAALGAADTAVLAGLDAPWRVLAAAAGPGWRGELLHSGAPHGVPYHVAVWTPAG